LLFFSFVIVFSSFISAQNLELEMMYPDTLRSANDSLYINSPKWEKELRLGIFKGDTINWGLWLQRCLFRNLDRFGCY